jgi:hypothetical protein
VEAAAILIGHGLIIWRRRGNSTRDGIYHHFQQTADGVKLARAKLIEQVVSEIFIHL